MISFHINNTKTPKVLWEIFMESDKNTNFELKPIEKKYIISSIIVSICCFLCSFFTSINLSTMNIVQAVSFSIVTGLASYFIQKLVGFPIISSVWFLPHFASIIYLLVPILNIMQYHPHLIGQEIHGKYVINSLYDVLFAFHLDFLFVLIQYPLLIYGKKSKEKENKKKRGRIYLPYCIYALLLLFSIIVYPLIFLVHFGIYKVSLNEDALAMIYQTNLNEIVSFWKFNFGIEAFLLFAGIGVLLTLCFSLFLRKLEEKQTEQSFKDSSWKICLAFYAVIFSFIVLPNTILGNMVQAYHNFQVQEKAFLDTHKKIEKIIANGTMQKDNNKDETILLIIGESASRSHMHVYNKDDVPFENTPWMESISGDDEFILFQNSFASYNTTLESLKRALTNISQYNKGNRSDFSNMITIMDIANLNGYHTHWFSNQGKVMHNGGQMTMLAETADETYFNTEHYNVLEDTYDERLLDELKSKKEELSHGKHFIVLHLQGSHFDYKDSYPKEFNRFGEDSPEESYANSLLYTDYLLKEIMTYGKEHLNLKLMLYFSDHGENMEYSHHPSKKYLDTIEVPMLLYASEKFQENDSEFRERIARLKERKDDYFSTDMVYNLLLGILEWNEIESYSNFSIQGISIYDPREDLSSDHYVHSEKKKITSMELPIDEFLPYK